jgi:RNA polymerase sigma-70 factor (ECF subfamily)
MDLTPTGATDADRDARRARDARLVEAALAGDRRAFGRLYDQWFDQVWNLARRIVRDDEVAAEVAQDAFLSAWRNLATLESVDAFGGWLLRIARNASFNRRRREQRSRPVDDEGLAVIEGTGASAATAPAGFGVEDRARTADAPASFAEDAELVALVRQAAGALGQRDAEVLDLQLRFGLAPAEIGEVMGMNRNAANQLCHRIRQRFAAAVRARVLWRGDRPACDALATMLDSAGVSAFDASAVKIAERHAEACPQCHERRELRLEPAAMFAAVPLVAAPVLLKQQAAYALEGAGVAMDGSAFGAAAGHGDPGDPGDSGEQADSGAHGRGRRRVRRTLAMAGVAVVVLLVAVGLLFATRAHDGSVDEVAAVGASTTTSSTSSTTVPSTMAVEPVPADSVVPEPVELPSTDTTVSAGGEPPPPPPPPPAIAVALSPEQGAPLYLMANAPVLTWSVTGAVRVTVEGPVNGAVVTLSTAPAGSTRVCPKSGSVPQECGPIPPGPYEYVVRAYDASGVLVDTEVATLTIVV